ncbi:MAG: right-handed parallel beta-helix repeat-containing protein, partial [Bacteroidota bacterium]
MRIAKSMQMPMAAAIAAIILGAYTWACLYFFSRREEASADRRSEAVVRNARELIAALRPGAVIKLAPGNYDLNARTGKSSASRYFAGGVIRNLKDVTLEALNERAANIVTRDGGAPTLAFAQCEGIVLRRLRLGHEPKRGEGCTGDVLNLVSCSGVTIEGCELFGCGLRGLSLAGVSGLVFRDSEIRECADDIMSLHDSRDLLFERSRFLDNGGDVHTGGCDNVQFISCAFVGGGGHTPSVYDADRTAVLTDEGTIAGEFGGHISRYVRKFDDWLSKVSLQDVWFSREEVYRQHLDLLVRLRKILGDELDSIGILASPLNPAARDWEIHLRPCAGASPPVYQDYCRILRMLAGESASLEQTKADRFIFRFLDQEEVVLRVEAGRDEFLAFLAGGDDARLEERADVLLTSTRLDPAAFFRLSGKQLSGETVIGILTHLVEIRREVEDEDYAEGGAFQEFVHREARFRDGLLYHLVDLRQKLPLLGDFVHYTTIASFRVDAATGRAYCLDLDGADALEPVSDEIKRAVFAYAVKNPLELGSLRTDQSVFLLVKDEPDRKTVEVEIFNDEGVSGMVLFELD